MYTISQVADMLNIKPHTLRYYEQERIIIPDRNANGIRKYTDVHVERLKFIKKLRETQMPIAKIKEYVRLYEEGEHTSKLRLKLLEEHREFIQKQVKDLMETETMIDRKVNTYKEILKSADLK